MHRQRLTNKDFSLPHDFKVKFSEYIKLKYKKWRAEKCRYKK